MPSGTFNRTGPLNIDPDLSAHDTATHKAVHVHTISQTPTEITCNYELLPKTIGDYLFSEKADLVISKGIAGTLTNAQAQKAIAWIVKIMRGIAEDAPE